MLSISDTGVGMTAKNQGKVMGPFFITKEKGQGTGLGLSMVYGFVKRSTGHIKIYSEPGEGNTIRIYFPQVQNDETIGEVIPSQRDIPKGDETIPIVDDEQTLVDVAQSHLIDLGCTIFIANNSMQALEVLKNHDDIDLLFTDVIIPGGMNSYRLALAVNKNTHHLRY